MWVLVRTVSSTEKLIAAVAGTVSEIRVKEGDRVKEGQVLMLLEYEKAIAQAQSDIEQGKLRLNQQNKGLQSLIQMS